MFGDNHNSPTRIRMSDHDFFIGQSVATLKNDNCNIRNQRLQCKKMCTNDSDIQFANGNSHRNMNIMFHTTLTVQQKN